MSDVLKAVGRIFLHERDPFGGCRKISIAGSLVFPPLATIDALLNPDLCDPEAVTMASSSAGALWDVEVVLTVVRRWVPGEESGYAEQALRGKASRFVKSKAFRNPKGVGFVAQEGGLAAEKADASATT